MFIYFGKRKDAVKVLFFDGSGMCLFYKRLDRRVFRLPQACTPGVRHVELDESLLDALLDGVDLGDAPKRAPRSRVRVH
jgi:transposase